MKKSRQFLSAVLAIVIAVSAIPFAIVSADQENYIEKYPDFPTGWSYEAMVEGVENGIITGYEDSTIRPKGLLTRAEMAAIITRAFGAERMANIIDSFSDVVTGDWFYDEISKSIRMQIYQGQGGGIMSPNSPITRQDAIVTLARALVLEKNDYSLIADFSDIDLVSDYAKGSMAAFIGRGYVHGYEDGSLRPRNSISREEFAQIMANIFSAYVRDDGEITLGEIDGEVILTGDNVVLRDTVIHGDLILGDGVGETNVTIENVKIDGRIVFRGGEDTTRLKEVTHSLIVVNDFNGIINFYHYSDEKYFKNAVYNTPATFLDRTVDGGTASGTGLDKDNDTKTVGYIDAKTGEKVPVDVGGTPGGGGNYVSVRFKVFDETTGNYKTITSMSVQKGGSNDTALTSGLTTATNALGADRYVQAHSGNISGGWYYLDGSNYVDFETNMTVNNDIDVYYLFNYVDIQLKLSQILDVNNALFSYSVPFEDTTNSAITHIDGFYLNKAQIGATIDAFIGLLKKQEFDIQGGNQGQFNLDLVSGDGVVNNIEYNYRFAKLLPEAEISDYIDIAVDDYFRNKPEAAGLIKNSIKRALSKYAAGTLATTAVDAFITKYSLTSVDVSNGGTTANINALYDAFNANKSDYENADNVYSDFYTELLEIAKAAYRENLDDFFEELRDDETFTIYNDDDPTKDRELVLKAVHNKLNNDITDDDINLIISNLPAVVTALFDADTLETIVRDTIDSYKVVINEAYDALESGSYTKAAPLNVSCIVKVIINPVEHIIMPSINKMAALFDNQQIKDLLDEDSLFVVTDNAGNKTYKLRTGAQYADILYNTTVLVYDYIENADTTAKDVIDAGISANDLKLANLKAALFDAGADLSLFKGLISAFSFTRLDETTMTRVVDNIDTYYAEFINNISTNSGFNIEENVTVKIVDDGSIEISQNGTTVQIEPNADTNEFIDFATIIGNIAENLSGGNTNEYVLKIEQVELTKQVLSGYKLYINGDHIMFRAILK